MYNYTITRISGLAVLLYLFAAGTAIGGLGGIVLGFLEKDSIGLLGGMFVGLIIGVVWGLTGLFCVFVFNILAPYAGGIHIRLETAEQSKAGKEPAVSPAPDQPEERCLAGNGPASASGDTG